MTTQQVSTADATTESVQLPADSQKTVLEALEAAGLKPAYGCRQGFCGACRTRLLQGQVRYLNEPLAWAAHDEIIPCVCHAETPICLPVPDNGPVSSP